MSLSQYLYFSEIPGPRSFEVISAVVAESRPRNRQRGLSGMLVFDGAHVCQYLEGDASALEALVQRIAADPRHRDMQVLLNEPLNGAARFERWQLGYLNLDDGRDLTHIRDLRGEAALQALLALVPAIDLGP